MPGARFICFLFLVVAALVIGACREQGDIVVRRLEFEGVKQVDKQALAAALRTRRGSRLPWGRRSFFDRRAFDADLDRIHAFYRDRGFPDARVASYDVKLNAAQDQVDIVLNISEGQPTIVSNIDLTGFDVLTADEQRDLRDSLTLRTEKPFDRQLALASREAGLSKLRERGYAYADVSINPQPTGPSQVSVTFAATPGPVAYFGPVEVTGAMSVGENVIRRQMTFKPGDVFNSTRMRETQRKLYGLDLFEFANVESKEDRALQNTDIPTRVTVVEGKHRRLTTGVGYGSEEKARATIQWEHLNFLGGARRLSANGQWSSLDRGARMNFTEPYLFSSHFSFNIEGGAWNTVEPVYTLNSVGTTVTVRHQANSQNYWTVSLLNQFQRSTVSEVGLADPTIRNNLIALGLNPLTGFIRGTTTAVQFDITRNTADNALAPTRGVLLSGHLMQAGKWLGGTYDYVEAGFDARRYKLVAQTTVWANRFRVSRIKGFGGPANVPFFKRYFLGGANSLRGWGRFEVSPLSPLGQPIGGLSFLEGASELRRPLKGKFSGVLFLDYGNVWTDTLNLNNSGSLRYDVGTGLRYLTPVGPARIDFGYQLTPIPNLHVNGEPETRQWRIHFSVGQAF